MGLGLAISQRLAEAHGGHLTAASGGKDRGATFTLRLPAASGRVAAPTRLAADLPRELAFPPAADPPGRRQQGHPAISRRAAGTAFSPGADGRGPGHRQGTRGLGAFDLLISDIELPDGSGLELMHEIREPRGFPGIAMSGFGSEEDVRMSEAAGFVAHLTKPITFQALEATIRRAVMADDPAPAPSQSAG